MANIISKLTDGLEKRHNLVSIAASVGLGVAGLLIGRWDKHQENKRKLKAAETIDTTAVEVENVEENSVDEQKPEEAATEEKTE